MLVVRYDLLAVRENLLVVRDDLSVVRDDLLVVRDVLLVVRDDLLVVRYCLLTSWERRFSRKLSMFFGTCCIVALSPFSIYCSGKTNTIFSIYCLSKTNTFLLCFHFTLLRPQPCWSPLDQGRQENVPC